jgi:hypothetical protein
MGEAPLRSTPPKCGTPKLELRMKPDPIPWEEGTVLTWIDVYPKRSSKPKPDVANSFTAKTLL